MISSNSFKFYCFSILCLIFLIPTYYFGNVYRIGIDNYLYAILIVLYCTIILIISAKNMLVRDIFYIFMVIAIVIIQEDLNAIHLLSLIIVDRIVKNKEFYRESIMGILPVFYIGIVGIAIYSIIYGGYLNRYLYVGIREVNTTGLAVFLLAVLIRERNKYISYFIFAIGMLTFSKNYILSVFTYVFLKNLLKKENKTKYLNWFTFTKIAIVSSVILILFSEIFQEQYLSGNISQYAEFGWQRYLRIFDTSNYDRFIVNTDVIRIYSLHPNLLFTGIKNTEFIRYKVEIANIYGEAISSNRPHNYFFSYIQLYGIFSLVIFYYMRNIFNKLVNSNNFPLFISIFIYAIFLGMGFNSYWLAFSVIVLIVESANDRKEELAIQEL